MTWHADCFRFKCQSSQIIRVSSNSVVIQVCLQLCSGCSNSAFRHRSYSCVCSKQTPYLEMLKWSYWVTARQGREHLYSKTPNSLSRHRMWGAHKAPQIKYKGLWDVFLLLMLVLVREILRFLSASHRRHRWLKRVHRLDDVPLWSKETKNVIEL